MKKIIIPENFTIRFGIKFSHLKNVPNRTLNNLNRYAYWHLYGFIYQLAFTISSVESESSPLYTGKDILLAIHLKKVEDVSPIHLLVSQEIERLNKVFKYCTPEKLALIGEDLKGDDFSSHIDSIIEEIDISLRHKKLTQKIKAKSKIKPNKI